jgi:hypothetical protein
MAKNTTNEGRFYKKTPLDYDVIETQVKFLQGKVLTVVDAVIVEPRQLKATKDLMNKMFSEQLNWIAELCYPQLSIKSREQVAAMGVDVDAVEREATPIS